MEVTRDTLIIVAELWSLYLQQKITAADVETMLWLAGLEIERAGEECAS